MTKPGQVFDFPDDAPTVDVSRETLPDRAPDHEAPTYTCVVCGTGLHYGGRGRKPKYCDDHKPGKSAGTGTRGPRRPKLDQLQKQLSGTLAMVGATVSMIDQFDGFVIVSKADDMATALCAVAEQNDKVRKALENMLTASAWSQVFMVGATIAIPIAAHHHLIPAQFAQAFVTEDQHGEADNTTAQAGVEDDVTAAA